MVVPWYSLTLVQNVRGGEVSTEKQYEGKRTETMDDRSGAPVEIDNIHILTWEAIAKREEHKPNSRKRDESKVSISCSACVTCHTLCLNTMYWDGQTNIGMPSTVSKAFQEYVNH